MFKSAGTDYFKKRSEKILGVFTKTQDELKKLNEEQKDYANQLQSQIDNLHLEQAAIHSSISQADSVISKMQALIS